VALPSAGPGQLWRSETSKTVTGSAAPNAAIPDTGGKAESTIHIADELDVQKLAVNLDIPHTYKGDLVVTLTSPSGKSAVLHNRTGGSADDVKGRFDLTAFAGEPAKGDWKLTVEDKARRDTGTLKSWGLEITGTPKAPPPPPPPPAGADSDPMTHIKYLSSDEMKGRDSPSAELHAAAGYVKDFAKKYGLTGPNSNNPADPFVQSFNLFSFAGVAPHGHDDEAGAVSHTDPSHWGTTTFDEGFYLEDNMKPETLALINQRYEETMRAAGKPVAPALSGTLRSPAELRALAQKDGTVPNVMAKLEGTGPHKDEVIVVMAHLDHVGVGKNGVNNGADDNASGSAVLMASIPELVEKQKRGELDRSIVFVWTGAEEKGLVGSQYFVDHPIPGLGLKEIAGVVNVDMVGRWDDQRMSIVDTGSRGQANYFRDIAEKANAKMADPFDKLNRDINQFRDRQDGAVFTRKGEDVLFLFEGLSNPNGGGGLIPEYHGPGDDVDKIIADNGGNKPRRVKDFLVNVLDLAVNRTVQPAATPERRPAAAATAEQPVLWR
jgi:subtilisin-like proprotein convertase family protein